MVQPRPDSLHLRFQLLKERLLHLLRPWLCSLALLNGQSLLAEAQHINTGPFRTHLAAHSFQELRCIHLESLCCLGRVAITRHASIDMQASDVDGVRQVVQGDSGLGLDVCLDLHVLELRLQGVFALCHEVNNCSGALQLQRVLVEDWSSLFVDLLAGGEQSNTILGAFSV